jgi:predicted DNA-binding transcriptional regulator AlpA
MIELKKMFKCIQDDLAELKRILTLSTILNKDILSLKEASLYTGYSEKYLYKLNSTTCDLPVYSAFSNGKLYFKRVELDKWMTKHKGNSIDEVQLKVENYLLRNIA